jgi:transposase-like protein
MSKDNEFDWKAFEKEAIARLMKGDEISGTDGIFTPLIQRLLQASIDGEMQAHVAENRPNRRNGSKPKKVKSSQGLLHIDMPRDRDASFDSQIVPKRKTSLGDGLDNKILAFYGLGMSYSDISTHLAEMYGLQVSEAALSAITDKVMDELHDWQKRGLDPFYPFVWLDAIHYKVRNTEGRVVTRAMYTVLAMDLNGQKELRGLYLGEHESARFWMGILGELKDRGVQDILVASVDGLKGFTEAINSIFPHTRIQLCLVHQMRNSMKYVSEVDRRKLTNDLREIYKSASRELAEQSFERFCAKWGQKYPMIERSWSTNWDQLMEMYEYPAEVRKIIYTTNPVEGVHRQLRKTTKTKGAFVNDQALVKLIFLTYKRISLKWTKQPHHWGLTLQRLQLLFPERINPYFK